MADPKGFLKHGREVASRRPVEERVKDWDEVYPEGMGRTLLPIITEMRHFGHEWLVHDHEHDHVREPVEPIGA